MAKNAYWKSVYYPDMLTPRGLRPVGQTFLSVMEPFRTNAKRLTPLNQLPSGAQNTGGEFCAPDQIPDEFASPLQGPTTINRRTPTRCRTVPQTPRATMQTHYPTTTCANARKIDEIQKDQITYHHFVRFNFPILALDPQP